MQLLEEEAITQPQFFAFIAVYASLVPARAALTLGLIDLLDIKLKMKIICSIEFGMHVFRSRKAKWMNDKFELNENVHHFYR